MIATTLHPTVWRTCRVLANRTRLRLLAKLLRQQPQSVSQLAESLALTPPVASQGLRALEARGLLKARRIRRYVQYHIPDADEAGVMSELLGKLRCTLQSDSRPNERITLLATGFTHPTRVEIYRRLYSQPLTQSELKNSLGISWAALSRHLAKLLRRGYVLANDDDGRYAITSHPHPLGRTLAKLALT